MLQNALDETRANLDIDRFSLTLADWASFKAWRPAIVRGTTSSNELMA